MCTINEIYYVLKREHFDKEFKTQILKEIIDLCYEHNNCKLSTIIPEAEKYLNEGVEPSETTMEYIHIAVERILNKKYDNILFSEGAPSSPKNVNLTYFIDYIMLIKELNEKKYSNTNIEDIAYTIAKFFCDGKFKDPGKKEFKQAHEFAVKLKELAEFIENTITNYAKDKY